MENILIEFNAKVDSIDTAAGAIENLGEVDKKVVATFTRTNAAVQKLMKEREKSFKDSGSSVVGYAEKVANADKAAAGLFGTKTVKDYEVAIKRTLSETVKGFNLSDQQARKFFKNLQDEAKKGLLKGGLQAELEQYQATLNVATQALKDLGEETENTEKKSTSLKTRLREIKEQLSALETAGQDGTKAFRDLSIEAAALEDQIGDTNAMIKAMSSDTFAFDAVISGVQGIASAFQVGQGAMELFGSENEDLQKALVKLNAIMAITQGLQQVRQTLEKQSAVIIAITNAQQKITILQTNLQAAAESKNIAVRYAAIAAQKILNAVMLANPAGLLLITIGAIAGALLYFTSNTDDAAEAQKRLNAQIEFANSLNDRYAKGIVANTALRIAELKRAGASEREIREAEIDGLRQQLKITEDAEKAKRKAFEDAQVLNRAAADQRIDLSAEEIEQNKKVIDDFEKTQDRRFELLDQIKLAELGNETETGKELEAKRKEELDKQKAANEKRKQEAEKSAAEAAAISRRNAAALFEIEERRLKREADLFNEYAGNDGNESTTRLTVLNAYLQKQTELLNVQRRKELANDQLTNAERLNIIDKYNAESEKLVAETSLRRNAIVIKYDEELKAFNEQVVNDLVEGERKKGETIVSNINSLFANINNSNAGELDGELSKLEDNYKQGLLSTEAYQERRQEIINRYNRQDVNNEIARLNALLSSNKLSVEERTDTEGKLYAERDKLRNLDLQKDQEALQKKQAIQAAINDIRSNAFEAASNIAQIFEQRNQAAADQELNNINKLKEQKIINEEEAQRRMNVIRRNAAVQEKKSALFSAFLSQSQAVLAVLGDKTIPTFLKPFVIAGTIASALTQIALIASRPLPQLYKGTKSAKEGIYRTGELGMELMWHKDTGFNMLGKRGEEVAFVPEGARVFNAFETADIIKNFPQLNMPQFQMPNMRQLGVSDTGKLVQIIQQVDPKAIGKELRDALKEMPSYSWNIDNDGIAQSITNNGSRTTFINRKYFKK